MEKKLKLYESKILHSENNDVEAMAQKAAEREAQLKQKREELEKRQAIPGLHEACESSSTEFPYIFEEYFTMQEGKGG